MLNFEDDYFYWTEDAKQQAEARKVAMDMYKEDLTEEELNGIMEWIDRGYTRIKDGLFSILINRSKEDEDWKTVDTYLDL